MGMAAAVPTGTPVEGETSADADMPFARSGVEEIEKGQESSADAVSPNLARDETSSPEVSAGFQQATPDPLLPEEPSVAYSTSPFSLQDNVGNALRSASGSGEDSGTQETPGAAASDDGSLTVSNESQGLALPLRQLEIAFGITLVVLVVASLLIAPNNGLWPFRR
jgi:hypothetical protein